MFPFPFNLSDKFTWPDDFMQSIYHELIPWIGKNILSLEHDITNFTGGSGDTTYDYVLLLFFVVLSIFVTIVWSIAEKRKVEYKNLNYIFEIILSYFLGAVMISYGLYKVVPLQFSEPSFFRLLQSYGTSSPMGLAWTFLGASKGYVIFSGLAETIGGALLFHKKTRLLGSLILIPVLVNVVAINFFYDVPVKLFSSQLLVFAILIMLPDFRRLKNVILNTKATVTTKYHSLFEKSKWKVTLKWLFFAYVLLSCSYQVYDANKLYGPNSPKPPLYGLYEVSSFIINKDTITPHHKDTIGWRYVTIERLESIQIHRNDMKRKGFKSKIDTVHRKIMMERFRDSTKKSVLNYFKTDSTLTVSGFLEKDTIYFETKRLDKNDFLLMNRGFHWINERPFNR